MRCSITSPSYDIWLKPLTVKNMVRGENQKGVVRDGSVFKLKMCGRTEYINIKNLLISTHKQQQRAGKGGFATGSIMMDSEDYACSFKILQVSEKDRLRNCCLSNLAMFLRGYDIQALLKAYDFTESTTLNMLAGVLKRMKKLSINALPAMYSSTIPYHVPNVEVQMVN